MKNDKPLTDREKQVTILPGEADPKTSLGKAQHAVNKAMQDLQKSRRVKR